MDVIIQAALPIIGIGLVIGFLRRWIAGGVCRNSTTLKGKTVLITGCNTGIGKETALDMSKRGAKVVMLCRNLDLANAAADDIRQETGGGEVVVYKLDLASLASVRDCAKEVLANEDRIDVLINNAGIMMCPQMKTEDGFEMQMGTNHLGHFLLTNLLLDKLKCNVSAVRIVNVSSKAHESGVIDPEDLNNENKPYNRLNVYCNSKLANVLFTLELNNRLRGTNITCYSLHPGVIRTELARHVEAWIGILKYPFYFFGSCFMKTPEQGAQTTIYCATEPGLEAKSGKYFSDCEVKRPVDAGLDRQMAEKLWLASEKLVCL